MWKQSTDVSVPATHPLLLLCTHNDYISKSAVFYCCDLRCLGIEGGENILVCVWVMEKH